MANVNYQIKELNDNGGTIEVNNSTVAVKMNNTAIAPPVVTSDYNQGYSVGSLWIDSTNNKAYVCEDNTSGSATWLDLTGGGATMIWTLDDSFANYDTLYCDLDNSKTTARIYAGNNVYRSTNVNSHVVAFGNEIHNGSNASPTIGGYTAIGNSISLLGSTSNTYSVILGQSLEIDFGGSSHGLFVAGQEMEISLSTANNNSSVFGYDSTLSSLTNVFMYAYMSFVDSAGSGALLLKDSGTLAYPLDVRNHNTIIGRYIQNNNAVYSSKFWSDSTVIGLTIELFEPVTRSNVIGNDIGSKASGQLSFSQIQDSNIFCKTFYHDGNITNSNVLCSNSVGSASNINFSGRLLYSNVMGYNISKTDTSHMYYSTVIGSRITFPDWSGSSEFVVIMGDTIDYLDSLASTRNSVIGHDYTVDSGLSTSLGYLGKAKQASAMTFATRGQYGNALANRGWLQSEKLLGQTLTTGSTPSYIRFYYSITGNTYNVTIENNTILKISGKYIAVDVTTSTPTNIGKVSSWDFTATLRANSSGVVIKVAENWNLEVDELGLNSPSIYDTLTNLFRITSPGGGGSQSIRHSCEIEILNVIHSETFV